MKKHRIYIVSFFLFVACSIHTNVFSQIVRAQVDKDKILIGQQIKLRLTLQTDKKTPNWFQFPDSIDHLLILNRSKIDTILNGGVTNYNQTITITSFDSGTWQFPSLSLATINQSTAPINISVMPVDVSKLQDYHDIKEIEEVKQENDPVIIAIIVTITILSIILCIWLLNKKKKITVQAPSLTGNLSPLQWALSELDKLQKQALYNNSQVKKHYVELTNITRTFFHLQLHQSSLQQTTDEWMVKLQSIPLDNESKISFFQLLRLADSVKFAKYLPPSYENERSIETTKLMVEQVAGLQQNVHPKFQPQS